MQACPSRIVAVSIDLVVGTRAFVSFGVRQVGVLYGVLTGMLQHDIQGLIRGCFHVGHFLS